MSNNAVASTSVLTPALLTSFRPSKVFKKHNQNGKPFTAISFEDRGEFVITSAQDDTMQLFNCKTGKHTKVLNSKKYGVDLARFTHKSSAVIHASTKEDGQFSLCTTTISSQN